MLFCDLNEFKKLSLVAMCAVDYFGGNALRKLRESFKNKEEINGKSFKTDLKMESSLANFTQCLRDEETVLKFYLVINDDGQMPGNLKKAHEVSFPLRKKVIILKKSDLFIVGNKGTMS